MRILYIDTTTTYLYTGIVEDNKLLSQIKKEYKKDLSSVTLKNISDMLDSIHLKINDIDKIMVVNGPGSFTGIRIGVTLAKTMAYALKKDIITISSLEAMALSSKKNMITIPIIDARRGFVYGAIYDKYNNPILKDQYIKLDTLKLTSDNLIDDYTFIGNNSLVDDIEGYDPDILKIVSTYKDRESINPHMVNPIYLKRTEAEESKNIEVI